MVVKDTTLFHSTENLADIVAKIRENLENHPALALRYFLVFLDMAGFSLEDLQNDGWKKISDDEWDKIVKGDAGEERAKWLPRILEICSGGEKDRQSAMDAADRFEEILKNGLPGGNCLIFTAKREERERMLLERKCIYHEDYAASPCCQETVDGFAFCKEHLGVKCKKCGKQATGAKGYCSIGVIYTPLCDECYEKTF